MRSKEVVCQQDKRPIETSAARIWDLHGFSRVAWLLSPISLSHASLGTPVASFCPHINVRTGSCVTSAAGVNWGAQLYERWRRGLRALILPERHPARRRREARPGFRMERENPCFVTPMT